uniref:Integrase catalytic domain-containing protein n=1 Tax=Fagus sylvatica TaxID=28930 RepID=A0A2N9IA87_FAGSY
MNGRGSPSSSRPNHRKEEEVGTPRPPLRSPTIQGPKLSGTETGDKRIGVEGVSMRGSTTSPPLNAPVDHIFMQIRNDPALKWPGKLLTDPDKRPRDKYCRFHRDHGHNTEDCYDLKRQIEELIKQGKLQRFVERGQREGRPQGPRQQRPPVEVLPRPPPLGEIHVITGGVAAGGTSRSSRKAYARQTRNVLVTQKMDKKPRLEDLPITFAEEDARKVFHPHDDALVVTLEIAGYSTRRVLIDNGSSADIIYLTAFQQMRIDKNQLRPIETPLVGFAGTSVYPLGIITLQLIAGTYPKQATKKVDFLVVDCPSAYNVIIGRPTLNRLRAVTSTYHLLVRFPTEEWDRGDEGRSSNGLENQKRRVFAPERNAAVMEEVDKLLQAGFIREVYYPGMACQRGDGQKIHRKMANMAEEDQEKTAFITSRGLFCYKVMPFGLKNAGATYQRLVNRMFHDQIGRNVEVYVDDMLVKSKKDDDHLADLKETFQALRRYNMKLNPAKCVFGVSSGKFLGFMVSQRGIEANPDKIKAILEMTPPKTVKEVQSLTGKAAALNRFVSRSTDKCLPFFKILRKAFQWTEECQQAFEELKAYLTSPPLLSPSQTGEALYLYLAVSASAVSSALIREEERVQKPVYYTSRALRGAEERYTNMEKLAFALLVASRKLRPYFQAHSIIVMTDYPIRKAMNKPDAAGRLVQWKMRNQEKAEAWTVNIDGSSTKEMSGAGVILVSPEGDKFEYALQLRFHATNNEAEYEALLAGLRLSKGMGIKVLTIKERLSVNCGAKLLQIPREDNVAADRLARLASSGIEIDGFIEIQGRPSTEEESSEHHRRQHNMDVFHDPTLDVCHREEANYVIREVHEGICGNHSGARSLAHKLTRAGYYWPSLLHDATQYVKACDKCQRFANIPRAPPEEITPITSPWPFAQWGLDIMGPFPMCSQLNIKNHYSSPRHPQANGQVEVTNRTLLKQIKTRLEGAKGMWVEELPSMLWAYQTTVRTPTRETPFKLTFGTEAVIPVEIGLTTFRTTFHREEENEGQLRLNLDLLDETRGKAAQRIALYQGRMARYYNTKVKLRRFEVGDWVLRKVTQATKDPSQGKLGPNWEGPYKVIQYYRRGTYHLEDRHGRKLPHPWNAEHLKKHLRGAQVRHLRGAPVRHLRGAQVRHPRGAPVRHPRGALVRHPRGANVRHPRGALKPEDCQGYSVPYQVRHPRGAFTEEDLQESSSVRHPKGAFIEEDLQASSSVPYQVRHPKGAFIEEDLQASSSVSC